MELSRRQRQRIDDRLILLAESRTRKLRRERLHTAMYRSALVVALLFVVGVVLMLIDADWVPGEQEQEVVRQYHSQPHRALDVFPSPGETIATR